MKVTKKNVKKVLAKLNSLVDNEDVDIDMCIEPFNDFLNELHGNDFFGTEGQNDPRGDQRNKK